MSEDHFDIMTRDDKADLEVLIDEYISSLFKKDPKIDVPKKFVSFFEKYGYSDARIDQSLDKEEVKSGLNEYKKSLDELNEVKVTISFEPTTQFIKDLYLWIRSNLSAKGFVLDINVDLEIIGGVVLVWEGRYIDLSVRERLKDYFKENRKDVQDILWS